MNWHLGVIRDQEGRAVNHRSLLKVLTNPLLRLVGWEIATAYCTKTRQVGRPLLQRNKRWKSGWPPCWSFDYKLDEGWIVEPTRRWI